MSNKSADSREDHDDEDKNVEGTSQASRKDDDTLSANAGRVTTTRRRNVASTSSWAPAGARGKERDDRDVISTPPRQGLSPTTPQRSLYRRRLRHMSTTATSSITTIHSNERTSPKLFRQREEKQDHGEEHHQEETSFTDWLTGETLSFLRWTGGVTLSTTGKLVAPPIHLTNSVILPALFTTLVDWIDKTTPQRVKDWVRILTSSVTHVISVLRTTPSGITFRSKLVDFVGGDVLGVLSSDEARQAVVDGMACTVKLSEALHTPEVHDLLQQLSVLGCRMVDVASSGKSKELICDFYELVWSGMEVMADPKTTLALAEVTAYLCRALEMQDAVTSVNATISRDGQQPGTKSGQTPRRKRRQNRQDLQRRVYGNPVLLSNPNTTVEEVILSSLDRVDALRNDDVFYNEFEISDEETDGPSAEEGGGRPPSGTGDIPSNVILEKRLRLEQPAEGEAGDTAVVTDWKSHARSEVNVEYLKECISDRASALESLREETRLRSRSGNTPVISNVGATKYKTPQSDETEDLGQDHVEDVENLDECLSIASDKPSGKIPKQSIDRDHTNSDDEDYQQERLNTGRMEGETPVDQFYRILDEFMEEQRQTGTDYVLSRLDGGQLGDPRHRDGDGSSEINTRANHSSAGRVSKRRVNQLSPGEDVRSRYDSIRRRLSTRITSQRAKGMKPSQYVWRQHRTALLVGLAIFGIVFNVLLGFALYGGYKFFFPSGIEAVEQAGRMLHLTSTPPTTIAPHSQPVSAEASPTKIGSEIVIRIIREVVHVNEDGTILKEGTMVDQDQGFPTQEQLDKVADCVSSTL